MTAAQDVHEAVINGARRFGGEQMKPRPKDAKPRKRALKQRRELFQYDGCAFIGRIVVDPSGEAKAFNSFGKRLGMFPGFRAAMAAISAAHISAVGPTVRRATKRASKFLSRPSAHG
jgi:hypothetical protein